MKISYNWLKWYIDGELPTPETLADILTFKLCEVEGIEKLPDGDTILDLNILPNRAHDLLSHQGVAREVAGLLGVKYKDPTPLYKQPEKVSPTNLNIEINTSSCRRYMGRVVHNIKVGPSPDWVVKHLESIGQRSINNIVDATNIVMFDCGNPCHAFDARKITDFKIDVREAGSDQDFPVLGRDQIVAKLKAADMVVVSGESALAIAGVKGGLNSGIDESTTDIVLEVANFNPVAVRKTARRLNLLSDSAKRFENDLSAEHAAYAMRELSATILEMCPEAQFEEIVDIYPSKQETKTISFSVSKINKYLGTNISESEMSEVLTRYGYEISGTGDTKSLNVPYLRLDLTGPHDVAEEVARLYGLDKISPVPVEIPTKPNVNEKFAKITAIKEKLVADEYRETITYAFRKKGVYEVARGVGDKGALRTNLSDGLKESYELNKLNAALFVTDEIKLFEVGNVFSKDGEVTHVALADKKGVREQTIDQFASENNIEASEYALTSDSSDKKFVQWSVFPFITRDIAVWVPEGVSSEQVYAILKENAGDLSVIDPYLFDTFSKEGRTSYAFRLVFQATDRTLTDAEIEPVMQGVIHALQTQNWEVR